MTKATQRQSALTARRALGAAERAAFSAAVCETLAALPALRGARTILSYRALWDEADPAGLEELLGARFAFPRCLPGRELEARLPTGLFRAGAFGIPEPDPAASVPVGPEELDAVLVPCLGFDAAGHRLGHGAGYYDRYLPRCRKALLVCLAFEAQRLDAVETDAHDVPMALIVTERGVYPRGRNTVAVGP